MADKSTRRRRIGATLVTLSALVALVLAYLLVLAPRDESIAAPLLMQQIVPRVAQLAGQVARAPSRLWRPAVAYNKSPLTCSASSFTPSHLLQQQHHTFSNTAASRSANMPHDTTAFKEAVQHRRTIYQLTKKSPISDARIKEILTTAIEDTPSSFNSQSARLVVLLKEEHTKFWDIVTDILKAHVPEDKWEHTGQRLAGFSNAYGTVLFYEDPEPIHTLQKQFAQYADKFPQWSEHTSAMHQYVLWTAFESEGLGCNLQHYNPLPDQKASETWGIPLEWSLKAQLVFGEPAEGAREKLPTKEKKPFEDRVKIYGA